ncbi:MAG: polysaccharide deacetylase family protein [Bacteroidales bacterium]|nr:polysaccharide deacetylase family protein [Bacteroidales bacterium]MBS3775056.1 polysaccharide deacetylase family protein [Bacteroidales bacterium]
MNYYRLAAKGIRQVTWYYDTKEKNIYLTFDDGPTSKITPWILHLLEQYNARATFFCLGRQVEQFPLQYEKILKRGHAAGNHTYSHLKGIFTRNRQYFEDVNHAARLIDSHLFRFPHGSFRISQIKHLSKSYQIIMWDVLSGDYNRRCSSRSILQHLLNSVGPGSIVVFHDSEKAEANIKKVLPQFLKHFQEEGYIFPLIPDSRRD